MAKHISETGKQVLNDMIARARRGAPLHISNYRLFSASIWLKVNQHGSKSLLLQGNIEQPSERPGLCRADIVEKMMESVLRRSKSYLNTRKSGILTEMKHNGELVNVSLLVQDRGYDIYIGLL